VVKAVVSIVSVTVAGGIVSVTTVNEIPPKGELCGAVGFELVRDESVKGYGVELDGDTDTPEGLPLMTVEFGNGYGLAGEPAIGKGPDGRVDDCGLVPGDKPVLDCCPGNPDVKLIVVGPEDVLTASDVKLPALVRLPLGLTELGFDGEAEGGTGDTPKPGLPVGPTAGTVVLLIGNGTVV
jgi:hypothetical protein